MEVPDTQKQALYTGLLTDPSTIASFIVGNNMPAIVDRLRGMGFIVNVPADIFTAFNVLLQEGRKSEFLQAVDVPLQVPPDSATALLALKAARAHIEAAKVSRSGMKNSTELFTLDGKPITLANVFMALGIGMLTLTGASGEQVQQVPQVDMNAAAQQAQAEAAAAQKRTRFIIGALVVLVVAVVLYSMWKKRK